MSKNTMSQTEGNKFNDPIFRQLAMAVSEHRMAKTDKKHAKRHVRNAVSHVRKAKEMGLTTQYDTSALPKPFQRLLQGGAGKEFCEHKYYTILSKAYQLDDKKEKLVTKDGQQEVTVADTKKLLDTITEDCKNVQCDTQEDEEGSNTICRKDMENDVTGIEKTIELFKKYANFKSNFGKYKWKKPDHGPFKNMVLLFNQRAFFPAEVRAEMKTALDQFWTNHQSQKANLGTMEKEEFLTELRDTNKKPSDFKTYWSRVSTLTEPFLEALWEYHRELEKNRSNGQMNRRSKDIVEEMWPDMDKLHVTENGAQHTLYFKTLYADDSKKDEFVKIVMGYLNSRYYYFNQWLEKDNFDEKWDELKWYITPDMKFVEQEDTNFTDIVNVLTSIRNPELPTSLKALKTLILKANNKTKIILQPDNVVFQYGGEMRKKIIMRGGFNRWQNGQLSKFQLQDVVNTLLTEYYAQTLESSTNKGVWWKNASSFKILERASAEVATTTNQHVDVQNFLRVHFPPYTKVVTEIVKSPTDLQFKATSKLEEIANLSKIVDEIDSVEELTEQFKEHFTLNPQTVFKKEKLSEFEEWLTQNDVGLSDWFRNKLIEEIQSHLKCNEIEAEIKQKTEVNDLMTYAQGNAEFINYHCNIERMTETVKLKRLDLLINTFPDNWNGPTESVKDLQRAKKTWEKEIRDVQAEYDVTGYKEEEIKAQLAKWDKAISEKEQARQECEKRTPKIDGQLDKSVIDLNAWIEQTKNDLNDCTAVEDEVTTKILQALETLKEISKIKQKRLDTVETTVEKYQTEREDIVNTYDKETGKRTGEYHKERPSERLKTSFDALTEKMNAKDCNETDPYCVSPRKECERNPGEEACQNLNAESESYKGEVDQMKANEEKVRNKVKDLWKGTQILLEPKLRQGFEAAINNIKMAEADSEELLENISKCVIQKGEITDQNTIKISLADGEEILKGSTVEDNHGYFKVDVTDVEAVADNDETIYYLHIEPPIETIKGKVNLLVKRPREFLLAVDVTYDDKTTLNYEYGDPVFSNNKYNFDLQIAQARHRELDAWVKTLDTTAHKTEEIINKIREIQVLQYNVTQTIKRIQEVEGHQTCLAKAKIGTMYKVVDTLHGYFLAGGEYTELVDQYQTVAKKQSWTTWWNGDYNLKDVNKKLSECFPDIQINQTVYRPIQLDREGVKKYRQQVTDETEVQIYAFGKSQTVFKEWQDASSQFDNAGYVKRNFDHFREWEDLAEKAAARAQVVQDVKSTLDTQRAEWETKQQSMREEVEKRTEEFKAFENARKEARIVVDMIVKFDKVLFDQKLKLNKKQHTTFYGPEDAAYQELIEKLGEKGQFKDEWENKKDMHQRVKDMVRWMDNNEPFIQGMSSAEKLKEKDKKWEKQLETIKQSLSTEPTWIPKVMVLSYDKHEGHEIQKKKIGEHMKTELDKKDTEEKTFLDTTNFVKQKDFGEIEQFKETDLVMFVEDLLGTVRIIARGVNRDLAGGAKEEASNVLEEIEDRKIKKGGEKYGPFNQILLPSSKSNPTNEELYTKLGTTMERLQQGESVTTIAYGYSGSGKTFGFFNIGTPGGKGKYEPGLIYQYFDNKQSDLKKVSLYARELYGDAEDASVLFLSTMTGELIEYGAESDQKFNVRWRGNRVGGKSTMYVDDEESPYPTDLCEIRTPVHHVNLMDPVDTERGVDETTMYGLTVDTATTYKPVDKTMNGRVVQVSGGQKGVVHYEGDNAILFRYNLHLYDPENATEAAIPEDKTDGDIGILQPNKQYTLRRTINVKEKDHEQDNTVWTFLKTVLDPEKKPKEFAFQQKTYHAALFMCKESITGDIAVLQTPMERALSHTNKFHKLWDSNDDMTVLKTKFADAYSKIVKLRTNHKRILRTPNNPESSRGHLFLTLKMEFTNGKQGLWHIGDLAGSENPLAIADQSFKRKDNVDWPTYFRTRMTRIWVDENQHDCQQIVTAVDKLETKTKPEDQNHLDKRLIWNTIRQGFFINESNHHLMAFCRKQDPLVRSYNMEYGAIDMGGRRTSSVVEMEQKGTDDKASIEKMEPSKILQPDQIYTTYLYSPIEGEGTVRHRSIQLCHTGDGENIGSLPLSWTVLKQGWGAWLMRREQEKVKFQTVLPNRYVRGGEVFAELLTQLDKNKHLSQYLKYDPQRFAQNPVGYIHDHNTVQLPEEMFEKFMRASLKRAYQPCSLLEEKPEKPNLGAGGDKEIAVNTLEEFMKYVDENFLEWDENETNIFKQMMVGEYRGYNALYMILDTLFNSVAWCGPMIWYNEKVAFIFARFTDDEKIKFQEEMRDNVDTDEKYNSVNFINKAFVKTTLFDQLKPLEKRKVEEEMIKFYQEYFRPSRHRKAYDYMKFLVDPKHIKSGQRKPFSWTDAKQNRYVCKEDCREDVMKYLKRLLLWVLKEYERIGEENMLKMIKMLHTQRPSSAISGGAIIGGGETEEIDGRMWEKSYGYYYKNDIFGNKWNVQIGTVDDKVAYGYYYSVGSSWIGPYKDKSLIITEEDVGSVYDAIIHKQLLQEKDPIYLEDSILKQMRDETLVTTDSGQLSNRIIQTIYGKEGANKVSKEEVIEVGCVRQLNDCPVEDLAVMEAETTVHDPTKSDVQRATAALTVIENIDPNEGFHADDLTAFLKLEISDKDALDVQKTMQRIMNDTDNNIGRVFNMFGGKDDICTLSNFKTKYGEDGKWLDLDKVFQMIMHSGDLLKEQEAEKNAKEEAEQRAKEEKEQKEQEAKKKDEEDTKAFHAIETKNILHLVDWFLKREPTEQVLSGIKFNETLKKQLTEKCVKGVNNIEKQTTKTLTQLKKEIDDYLNKNEVVKEKRRKQVVDIIGSPLCTIENPIDKKITEQKLERERQKREIEKKKIENAKATERERLLKEEERERQKAEVESKKLAVLENCRKVYEEGVQNINNEEKTLFDLKNKIEQCGRKVEGINGVKKGYKTDLEQQWNDAREKERNALMATIQKIRTEYDQMNPADIQKVDWRKKLEEIKTKREYTMQDSIDQHDIDKAIEEVITMIETKIKVYEDGCEKAKGELTANSDVDDDLECPNYAEEIKAIIYKKRLDIQEERWKKHKETLKLQDVEWFKKYKSFRLEEVEEAIKEIKAYDDKTFDMPPKEQFTTEHYDQVVKWRNEWSAQYMGIQTKWSSYRTLLLKVRDFFRYEDLMGMAVSDDKNRWSNITNHAIRRWNDWNMSGRKSIEPTRGFILMIPLLNSLMYPDNQSTKNKLVIVQNMRTEKTDSDLGKTIEKGVELTLEFSDAINPMSFKSAQEIAQGTKRLHTYSITNPDSLLKVDMNTTARAITRINSAKNVPRYNKDELSVPVGEAAISEPTGNKYKYNKRLEISRFVPVRLKDGRIHPWYWGQVNETETPNYIPLYNSDKEPFKPLYKLAENDRLHYYGPWVSTWEDKQFPQWGGETSDEEWFTSSSVLSGDFLRVGDMATSSSRFSSPNASHLSNGPSNMPLFVHNSFPQMNTLRLDELALSGDETDVSEDITMVVSDDEF